jgi:voltage-gated potassium channel Kch
MSVGMGVNMPAIAPFWPAVLLTALVIMILKTVVVFVAARLNGWGVPGATQLGFLLSQGSEFTLVVVGIESISGAMPGNWSGIITAAVALTLIAAPIWTSLGLHIAKQIAERSKTVAANAAEAAEENPVLVFGMTPEARLAADALRDNHIPYVAVESDPERFVMAASDGYTIVFGDAKDARLMETIGAARASAVVLGASGLPAPQVTLPAGAKPPPRFVAVTTGSERVRQAGMGFRAHLAHAEPRGVELVTDLLSELGLEKKTIAAWIAGEIERRGLIGGQDEEAPEPEAA